MPHVMAVGLEPSDILLNGDPAPPPKNGAKPLPQFLADVYCGQTAPWIAMKLGMEVGLGSGHIVLHGDPAPLPQRDTAPIFGPYLLWPNGWMVKMPLGM